MRNNSYRVSYLLGCGWHFQLNVKGKPRQFRGFATEWQAKEARVMVEKLRREGKDVPTSKVLRGMIDPCLTDTKGVVAYSMRDSK